MKKKLLTIYDLEKFYENHKRSTTFSSEKSGYQLAVQVPMNFETTVEESDGTLEFYDVKAFHIGKNNNHSDVVEEAAEKAMKNLAYKPILANFIKYIDPKTQEEVEDFTSHDMEWVENEDEENGGHFEYQEHQIGCFTADEAYFVEEDGRKYVCARICIPSEYTSANEIIKRKQGTKMSVELLVNEMKYDSSEKVLKLTDVVVQGLTALGTVLDENGNPVEVHEGMEGSGIKLKDFSVERNSIFSSLTDDENNKIMEMQSKISKLEDLISNMNDLEGGDNVQKQFEDEEDNVVTGEDTVEGVNKTVETEGTEETDAPTVEFEKKKFEISHEDIRYALYELLAPMEEMDGEWYYISYVYDGYFVYQGSSKFYGQKYVKDGNVVSFDGERYELFAEFLTASEKAELETMRNNYSSISEKLSKYEEAESLADKRTVFEDEAYAKYLEKAEFKELMKDETLKQFSKEEIKNKAELLFAKFAREVVTFSATDKVEPKKSAKSFGMASQDHECSFLDGLLNGK